MAQQQLGVLLQIHEALNLLLHLWGFLLLSSERDSLRQSHIAGHWLVFDVSGLVLLSQLVHEEERVLLLLFRLDIIRVPRNKEFLQNLLKRDPRIQSWVLLLTVLRRLLLWLRPLHRRSTFLRLPLRRSHRLGLRGGLCRRACHRSENWSVM